MKKEYYYKVYSVVFGNKKMICSGSYSYCRYWATQFKKENGYPRLRWENANTGKVWHN